MSMCFRLSSPSPTSDLTLFSARANCFKSQMGRSSGYVESSPPPAARINQLCRRWWFLHPHPHPAALLCLLRRPLHPLLMYRPSLLWNSMKGSDFLFFFTSVISISNPPRLRLGSHRWCRALSSHPHNSAAPQSQPNAARLFVEEKCYRWIRSDGVYFSGF